MFRAVAIAVLGLGAASPDVAMTAEQDRSAASAQSGAPQELAGQRARSKLAQHLEIGEDGVVVNRTEPHTWSDSSLGCGRPGTVAAQVITDGYAVFLSAGGRDYEVHVSGANAVVCEPGLRFRDAPRAANARGLDAMMERARQDLAQRLGVDASTIRLTGMEPQSWPDSALGCPQSDESAQPGPVAGYRLSLKHESRVYTYHTDRKTVRPCPAIESQ